MKTTNITLSLLCFIMTCNIHAADDVSNRNRFSEIFDATFNWLLKLSRDRDRNEKILWETSARTRSRIMHMLGHHTPESIAFLDLLHQAEAAAQADVPGKFQLKINYPIAHYFKFIQDFYEEEPHDELTRTKKFMQDNGIDAYYDYMITLASSTKLTDREKIKKEFVMLPFFKELCKKTKEIKKKKKNAIRTYCKSLSNHHAINRLFLAAFCYAGINLNSRLTLKVRFGHHDLTLLDHALIEDDIPLIEIFLQHGANPHRTLEPFISPLQRCRSLYAAQLLLQHGADFYTQHQQCDLINNLCMYIGASRKEDDDKLFPLFLSYVPLDESNKFGHKWIITLGRLRDIFPSYKTFCQKLSALLKHGCHYDHRDQQEIIKQTDRRFQYEENLGISPLFSKDFRKRHKETREKRKQEITALFEQDQNRRKNIVLGLRNRALTGKPLVPTTTNLRACYNRALDLNKIKSIPMITQIDGPLSFDNLPIEMVPL